MYRRMVPVFRLASRTGVVAGLSAAGMLGSQDRHPRVQCGPPAPNPWLATPSFSAIGMNKTVLYTAYVRKYGTDKKVELSYTEMKKIFSELQLTNDEMCKRLFCAIDGDGKGTVDFKEVCRFCRIIQNCTVSEKAAFVFDSCDEDGRGFIEKDQMRRVLMGLILACHETIPGFPIADADKGLDIPTLAQMKATRMSNEMFSEIEKDKRGHVTLKKFIFWIKRGAKLQRELGELFCFFEQLTQPVA